ncbi:type II CAAX endopeptidase family protein [Nonomuraea sp. NPDC050643]|uniref:CPBP family intramembrane glutamic endopeptidase n=1 Tax=Nonomuraea sp. NPDC050643 TaxID=3155660 RepID=UPI0033ECDF0A
MSEETTGEAVPAAGTPRWLRPAAVRLVLMLALFAAVSAVASGVVTGLSTAPVGGLVMGVVMAALALGGYVAAVRFTERRRAVELPIAGIRDAWRGTGVGVGLFTVTIAVIAVFGGYRVLGWGSFGGALAIAGVMCTTAVVEELLFRGVLFRIVEELTGTWGALGVSAVLFGVLHLVNPGASVWGALAIAVEAGLMLGAAYAATRTLWLPIGLHLGWNAAEVAVFGTISSGSGLKAQGLLEATMSGPAALTGGAFGPEASIVAILACGVPTVMFLRLARRRGRLLPRTRRTPSP